MFVISISLSLFNINFSVIYGENQWVQVFMSSPSPHYIQKAHIPSDTLFSFW